MQAHRPHAAYYSLRATASGADVTRDALWEPRPVFKSAGWLGSSRESRIDFPAGNGELFQQINKSRCERTPSLVHVDSSGPRWAEALAAPLSTHDQNRSRGVVKVCGFAGKTSLDNSRTWSGPKHCFFLLTCSRNSFIPRILFCTLFIPCIQHHAVCVCVNCVQLCRLL